MKTLIETIETVPDCLTEIISRSTYPSALAFLKTCKLLWISLTTQSQIQKIIPLLREERNSFEITVYMKDNNNNLEEAFSYALQQRRLYLIQNFMNFGVNPSYKNNYALRISCLMNSLYHVNLLLSDGHVKNTSLHSAFEHVCLEQKLPLVQRILLEESLTKASIYSCFYNACKSGSPHVVQILLNDPRLDPASQENSGIHIAVDNGHLPVVKFLMQDPRIDATFKSNVLISCACQTNRADVLQYLLTFDHLNPNDCGSRPLLSCIRYNRPDCLRILLNDPRVKIVDDFIYSGISYSSVECIRILLDEPRTNPNKDRNKVFRFVCSRDNFQILELFLASPRINPADRHNTGLKWASRVGNIQFVNRLLQDPRINPADKNNRALKQAYDKGKFEIVKILLRDTRVRKLLPTDECMLYESCIKSFDLLSAYPDPSRLTYDQIIGLGISLGSRQNALRLLCEKQNYWCFKECFERFWDWYEKDNSDIINSLLFIACEKGDVRFVNLILQDKKINPSTGKDWALRIACWYGNDDVVKRLLKCDQVDPTMMDNGCISLAHERGHKSSCKILLEDKRVLNTLSESNRLYYIEYTK